MPVMTLNEKLDRLSLGVNGNGSRDPVVQAITQGKQPTLAELKQSVKYLIRSLIAAVQTLNSLPRRRFVTFKLFYTDDVPDDYEPPHFRRGDSEKRYFFCTHSVAEAPEEISIGSLRTPYHCLDLRINSISDIIPQSNENEDTHRAQGCTSSETTEIKQEEVIKLQQADIFLRKVVWDAEGFVNPRNANVPRELSGGPPNNWQPIGVRPKDDSTGITINNRPMPVTLKPNIPPPHPIASDLTPTQVLETNGLVTPQPFSPQLISHVDDDAENAISVGQSCDVSTQALTDFLLKRDAHQNLDSSPRSHNPNPLDVTMQGSDQSDSDSTDVECDCSVNKKEPKCVNVKVLVNVGFISGAWGKYSKRPFDFDPEYVVSYHSSNDDRLPSTFWCFSCRLRNDPEIEILDSRNLTSEYITKYKDLCLFRRAIKVMLACRPDNVSDFTKLLGTEISTAAQTWRRLETEGFIHPEMCGKGVKPYGKNKNRNGKKGIKPLKYIPAIGIEKSQKFKDYFNPSKEAILIGMSKLHVYKEMINKGERRRNGLQIQDQVNSSGLDIYMMNKRKNGDYDDLARKRNKVSIAEPIDLEE
ncbi:hypothetical protein Clacol_006542 [Clathrus columnatus]|uniref:HORMA domain-containing protein n=1 Tax=Clathrus columnatus TaxID=1419009 RepID=A0AAV5ACC5_9AGAM|nr:hypothetical protein Clacol_006542 [Clathrus columnatus]